MMILLSSPADSEAQTFKPILQDAIYEFRILRRLGRPKTTFVFRMDLRVHYSEAGHFDLILPSWYHS